MKKVYTRTGDKGTTGIHGGARVPKDDIRIEANGCLDELNAVIGIVRSMDAMTAGLKENGYFLLPGGTPVSAQLHFARTVARRAERRLWTLHRQAPLNEDILRFVNRLSDLFFVMARTEMQRQDWPEEKWQEFTYKRKRL